MAKQLFIMIGAPVSGKSTWVKRQIREDIDKYVSRDEIRFSLLKEGDAYFKYEDEVFDTFVERIADYINDDNDIYRSISEATSTNQYYHKLEICKLFDANIENNKHMKLVKDNISKYKYGKFRPSEIILKLKEDIEGITKEEINTIDDVNNIFRM